MNIFRRLACAPSQIYQSIKRRRHTEQCRSLLKSLYADIDPFQISLQHRKQNHITDDQFIYGEIMYSSFADLLNVVKPAKNEIFYDLGCGGGKAVFTTALLYPDITVRGVEYLPPLFHLCQKLQSSLETLMQASHYFYHQPLNVELLCGDIAQINYADANIVYLNVTCFDNHSWSLICSQLEMLPVNARIIVISKQITSVGFELIHKQGYLMSWGVSTVSVYRKTAIDEIR